MLPRLLTKLIVSALRALFWYSAKRGQAEPPGVALRGVGSLIIRKSGAIYRQGAFANHLPIGILGARSGKARTVGNLAPWRVIRRAWSLGDHVRSARMASRDLQRRTVKQNPHIRHKLLQPLKVRNIGCEKG